MQNSEPGTRHGVLLVAVAWLAPIGATLFAPVLPNVIQHFSAVQHAALLAPIAMVMPALMVALLAPVAGFLADRFGRKRVLLWALTVYAATGIAPFWIDNLYLIIASRAVVGIAEAGVMTVSTALICDYFIGERRAHWLSVQFGSASLVATVCFALSGFLGGYSWRVPFVLYGAMILFVPLVLAIIFEPERHSSEEPLASALIDEPQLFSTHYVIGLALSLISGALFSVTPVHISLVLNEFQVKDTAMLGLASAVGSLGVVAGAALFRFQSTRSIGGLLSVAMGAQAIGYVILYTQNSLSGGIVGMFINNIGCGLAMPTVLAFTMSKLPETYRGRASGLWTSMFFIGQFLSPLCVAGLSAAGGGIVAAMGLLAMLTAVAAVVLLTGLLISRNLREPASADATVLAIH